MVPTCFPKFYVITVTACICEKVSLCHLYSFQHKSFPYYTPTLCIKYFLNVNIEKNIDYLHYIFSEINKSYSKITFITTKFFCLYFCEK